MEQDTNQLKNYQPTNQTQPTDRPTERAQKIIAFRMNARFFISFWPEIISFGWNDSNSGNIKHLER